MTERLELKEFLSAYLAEVEEQLQLANAKLLEIEASARDEKPQPRAVRDLFRALHTIKGLSAMVDVEPAVAIAHRMETVLRAADRTGGRLTLGAVDTLLQAIRGIEHRVREVSEHKIPSPAPRAILDALDELDAPSALATGAPGLTLDLDPAIAAKLAPFEAEMLIDAPRSGRRAMRADFSPSPAKTERGLSINSVRDRIGSIGEIVKVVPISVPPSDEAPGALTFAILLVTSVSDEELAGAAGVAPESLRVLLRTSAGEAAGAPLLAPEDGDDDLREPVLTRSNVVRVAVGRLDEAMEHLSTLIVTRSRLARAIAALTSSGVNTRELAEIMRDNARQLRDLRAAFLRVRMVLVSEVLDRLPILLRGIRRDSGKQVRLRLEAGNAELDKGVAERLFPAIVHLVRNAVDHAIEAPHERRAAGKPEEGTVRISCIAHSNTRLELLIADDGRGIDRAAIARRAGRDVTGDGVLLDALCRAGFSTRDTATATSGRGMGMDIVRRIVVDQLGGELSMKTELGVGTTFTLRVPITISIVDAFTTECCAQRFVVPVSTVEEILELDPAKVRHGPAPGPAQLARAGLIERRGEAIPLVDLGAVLALERGTAAKVRQAVIVRTGGELVGFALDRVIGQQEAVVRPLIDPFVQVPGVAGATDLGDGKPTLVLDLVALGVALAHREGDAPAWRT